jgi:F-box-like
MPSIIESLPTELLHEIFTGYLCLGDLVQLMRACKRSHQIIEPFIWTKIELHRPHYHEDYAFGKSNNKLVTTDRPYQQSYFNIDVENTFYKDQYYSEINRKFLKGFEEPPSDSLGHVERLASKVRWLCLEVDQYEDNHTLRDCWNALTSFVNLKYLEIHARFSEWNEIKPFNIDAAPLERLQTVKLRGYVPEYFVLYILQRPSHIIELELALLDDPVGSTRYDPRRNPPKQSEVPEDYEGMTEEDLDNIEDMDEEEIAPRPLGCLPESLSGQFKSLTHLWLCKPAAIDQDNHTYSDIYYSQPSDQRTLKEWASLLHAARGTLKSLTLEQRPATHQIEMDSTGSDEFMHGRCFGPSYRHFVEIVLPVLLEDAKWPALENILLCGLEVGDVDITPSGDPTVERQLRSKFPKVDITIELGRRILFLPEDGIVCRGGDVLGGNELEV